jgi:hypothetical protein
MIFGWRIVSLSYAFLNAALKKIDIPFLTTQLPYLLDTLSPYMLDRLFKWVIWTDIIRIVKILLY